LSQTLRILSSIDTAIVDAYFQQSLQQAVNAVSHHTDDRTSRLLEVVEVISGDNGELYASSVKSFLISISGESSSQGTQMVLEYVVEQVLTRIREGKPMMS